MKIFNFGRLRTLRKQNHMTQAQVGTLLGCSGATVSNWELGLTRISVNDLLKLSDIYHDDNFSEFFVESICDEHLITNEEKALYDQRNAMVEEAGDALEYALDTLLYSEIPFDYSKKQELFELEAILDQCAEDFEQAEQQYLLLEAQLNERVLQRRQNSNSSSTQQ